MYNMLNIQLEFHKVISHLLHFNIQKDIKAFISHCRNTVPDLSLILDDGVILQVEKQTLKAIWLRVIHHPGIKTRKVG